MNNESMPSNRPQVAINPQTWKGKRTWFMWMFLNALEHVNEIDVKESTDIPYQCISINGKVVAFIEKEDEWDSTLSGNTGGLMDFINSINPKLIFKQQYRAGQKYLPNTISAGYFGRTWYTHRYNNDILMSRDRPYDVMARMRTDEYHHPQPLPWMAEREEIVNQARLLENDGYNTFTGFTFPDRYAMELMESKIGFNWQGTGRLTFKIIEYLRAGVVPITQPLGAEWPIREDIILEHEEHCIFCDRPEKFAAEAKLLLKDKAKMDKIRNNILEFYMAKLKIRSVGEWYWSKLKVFV
jgi:hypothetical protein